MGQESVRLARDCLPCGASIEAAIDAGGFIRNTDIDGLSWVAGSSGSRIECHPNDALVIAGVSTIGALAIVAGIGEAGDFRPGRAEIGAPPEPIAAPRPQIEDAVTVGIDREPFAHRAARHVTAGFKWQVRSLEGVTSIC